MKTITITVADKVASKLDSQAFEEGMSIDNFLAKAIENNIDKLIRVRKWMNREEWNAISNGENCPDCAHILSGDNPYGYPIANLTLSRLDLMKSQFAPGSCILYCCRHVTEPYELSQEERQTFF